MKLTDFNSLGRSQAAEAVRPALDIPRWVDSLVDARPHADRESLLATAREAAHPFTDDEIEQALSHHPRIGERAAGESAEASLSRAEQSAVDPHDTDVQARLSAGNRAYEERFDRVFLIRAAGRTPEEILSNLAERLDNDPATEQAIVADQLRQIALLRLEGLIES